MDQHTTLLIRHHRWGALAVVAFGLMNQPVAMDYLHSRMFTHMFVVIAGLLVLGYVISGSVYGSILSDGSRADKWNTLGVNSWLIVTFSTAFWMMPVMMDMVVEATTLKWIRNFSLLLAGYMLRISVLRAHPFISLFFAWNILTMTLIQGILYLNLPLRVCNAYLLSDQEDTGKMLVMVSVILGLALTTKQYQTSKKAAAN